MQIIKQPAFDGKFYPKDTIELESQIKRMFEETQHFYEYSSRVVIVPHAGYFYSGHTAANTYQYFDKTVENVFILAPAHYVDFKGAAVSNAQKFSTPLGQIEINSLINNAITMLKDVSVNNAAFEKEHAIEVQIPFIQTILPNAKIVPIVYNTRNHNVLFEIISKYFDDERNGFVISSDLSHFYPKAEAEKIDEYTANMIETGDTKNFHPAQACGSKGIVAVTEFAKQNNYSLIRVELTNSAQKTKDDASVVGYGGWFLAYEDKNAFLKDNFSDQMISLAKESIKSGLANGTPVSVNHTQYAPVLKEQGACFVTLETDGVLRGCIGSVISHRPLIEDIVNNAFKAAFEDNRFEPLTQEEFENLTVSISLLSQPKEIHFKTEEELLEKIIPFNDGVIIKDNNLSAVYLPSVWEQIPDKKSFLESLKLKAGMRRNHFSKTFKAYLFSTEYIKEM